MNYENDEFSFFFLLSKGWGRVGVELDDDDDGN